jgi:hypothetical protein
LKLNPGERFVVARWFITEHFLFSAWLQALSLSSHKIKGIKHSLRPRKHPLAHGLLRNLVLRVKEFANFSRLRCEICERIQKFPRKYIMYMYFSLSIDALLPSALGATDLHTNSTCTRQENIRKVARLHANIAFHGEVRPETSSRWKSTWLRGGGNGLFRLRAFCDTITWLEMDFGKTEEHKFYNSRRKFMNKLGGNTCYD